MTFTRKIILTYKLKFFLIRYMYATENNDDNYDNGNDSLLTCSGDFNDFKLEKDKTTLEEEENVKHHIEHDPNTNDTKRKDEYNSDPYQTDDKNESRFKTKAKLLLTCNDEIDEYIIYNGSIILEEETRINKPLTNTDNIANVEPVDISKIVNRHSNENNNVLRFTFKHEINECKYYKDDNKQKKEKHSEQSIEYDENKIEEIVNVENN